MFDNRFALGYLRHSSMVSKYKQNIERDKVISVMYKDNMIMR